MTSKPNQTATQPGSSTNKKPKPEDIIVNDSLGTTDLADSTGVDDEKETGDAKARNKNTRED